MAEISFKELNTLRDINIHDTVQSQLNRLSSRIDEVSLKLEQVPKEIKEPGFFSKLFSINKNI